MDFTGDLTPPKPSTGHNYKGNLTNAYWVGAKDIEIGHRLLDDKGNYQTVIAIHTEQTPLNSYNLEVDTDHTFFIKGIDGVDAVWVHNKNCYTAVGDNPTESVIDGKTVTFSDYQVGVDVNGNPIMERKATIPNPDLATNPNAPPLVEVQVKNSKTQKVKIIDENKPNIIRSPKSDVIVIEQGKIGNWNTTANKPQANATYRVAETGHTYKIDAQSRVEYVEADLKLNLNHRNNYQQCKSGGCDRLSTDHGGHLIASMFNGLGEGMNIVPMDAHLNSVKGKWYEMEMEWRKILDPKNGGGTVRVRIEPIYSGNSKRPDEFIIIETINGNELIKHLKNTPTGE